MVSQVDAYTRRKRRPARKVPELLLVVGVAQLGEQRILTPKVVGSKPTASTDRFTTGALANASVAQVVESPTENRSASVRFRPEAPRWRFSSSSLVKGGSGRALVSKTGACGFDSPTPCQRPVGYRQRYYQSHQGL